MNERAVPYWIRLDHVGLGMPLPAIYVHRSQLPPAWAVMHRLVDVVERDEDVGLPLVSELALDIADPAGAHLVVVETTDTDRHSRLVSVSRSTTVASGYYTEPSTKVWRTQAYAGGLILLIIGHVPARLSAAPYELLFTPGTRMGVVPLIAPP